MFSKTTSLKMTTTVAGCTECNKSTYLYQHLLVISHKKSTVHGYESLKKVHHSFVHFKKVYGCLSGILRSCDRAAS
jgi:hypothetical protein